MKKIFICNPCAPAKAAEYERWPHTGLKREKCKICGCVGYGYDYVKKAESK